MVMQGELGTKGKGVRIQVKTAHGWLIGVVNVTSSGELSVEKVTCEAFRSPLEKLVQGISSQEKLHLSVPNGVEWCNMGHRLYPYAVAEEIGYHSHHSAWGEVREEENYGVK